MQKMYRYLANNKVTLVADLAGFITEYRPVYQKNLEVYRGIDNVVQFEIKNHDQKPVSLAGYTPTIVVFDENNNMIIERDGTSLDDITTKATSVAESTPDYNLEFTSTTGIAVGQTVTGTYIPRNTLVTAVSGNVVTINKQPTATIPLGTDITFQSKHKKGVFTFTITDNDLLDIKQQYLSYVVYLTDSNSDKTLTYADDHFGAKGTMYVSGKAFPGPVATHNISTFTQDSQSPTAWYSETINAQPGINGNSALHTAAVYTDSYVGNVVVQGTLDNQVTLNTFWADIDTLTFDGTETQPVPVNFNGVFSFLRFKTDSSPADTISQILVRN
jgi:hypothetical protein